VEDNILGFHVWRAETAGVFDRITRNVIRSQGSDTPYRFVDEAVLPGHTYSYRLEAIDRGGETEFFDLSSVEVGRIAALVLHAAAPNPFLTATRIAFDLPEAGPVDLAIYDVQGRKVRTLVDRELAASRHEYTWDGLDDTGRRVSPGTYLYRASSLSADQSGKVVLAN
jgi:hypothetical protein